MNNFRIKNNLRIKESRRHCHSCSIHEFCFEFRFDHIPMLMDKHIILDQKPHNSFLVHRLDRKDDHRPNKSARLLLCYKTNL
jgi:hypothetical protein